MSKTHRTAATDLKPRAVKRIRQWEAMARSPRVPLLFPLPDPPLWKPLG